MLVSEGDRRTLGSKAFDLYRCRLLGARVPEFVVVPTTFHSTACRSTADEGKTLAVLREDLEGALASLGGVVAVRSSSVAEDLSEGSNAGQFRTVLGVDTYQALEDAIIDVWRSSRGHPMAVIIQRMLDPEVSGVLFTRNPVTGSNETIIEHVDGLAEGLVSGKRDPTRTEIPNDGGTDAPYGHGFHELLQVSRLLEEGFGHPLDIEWARCGADIHIVQARPITNLPPPDMRSGPSYSRVHAEEFFSGPVTPLFFSIFDELYSRYYVHETLEVLGLCDLVNGSVLVRHKDHIYVDTRLSEYTFARTPSGLGRKRSMEAMPPDVLEAVMRRTKGTDPSGMLRLFSFIMRNPDYWITNLDRHFKEEVVPEMVHRLDGIGDLRAMDLRGLSDAYGEMIEVARSHIRVSKWGLGFYCIPLSEAMERFMEENGIEKDNLSLLMTGLDDNRTLDATRELQGLADIVLKAPEAVLVLEDDHQDYTTYRRELEQVPLGGLIIDHIESVLVRYGHRRLSRDLRSPSWRDDPMIPFGMVRALVMARRSSKTSDDAQCAVRRKASLKAIERALPWSKRWAFRTLSRLLARYTSFRELQRFYLDMILSRMRDIVLEISRRMVDGGVIGDVDDIFFLDMTDVNAFLRGREMTGLTKKALFNRLAFEGRTGTPGRYMRSGVDFDSVQRQAAQNVKGDTIHGQSVSPGRYRGRVRVINEMDRRTEVTRGDVVVTRCLDPGQTHFLMMAGALILEVGGMLSHGAILARELGVPTVAQVRNATELFKDGQTVFVDGSTGVVTVGP